MPAPTPVWVEGSPSFTYNPSTQKLTVAGTAYCQTADFWDADPTGTVGGRVTLAPPLNGLDWGDTTPVTINKIRETETTWQYKAEFSKELQFVGNETGCNCTLKFVGKHNNVDQVLPTPTVAMDSADLHGGGGGLDG
jgi:hypothetical protein